MRGYNPRLATPLIIRNNMPIIGWVFAAVWFGFLSIGTWLFVRDGGFHQFDYTLEVMVMLGFWLFGFGGLTPLVLTPRTRFTLGYQKAELVRRWLWRHAAETLSADILRTAQVRVEKDSDGDPHYSLILVPPGGEVITLKSANDRADIEALQAQLLASL
jgi:hypothetical protein